MLWNTIVSCSFGDLKLLAITLILAKFLAGLLEFLLFAFTCNLQLDHACQLLCWCHEKSVAAWQDFKMM